MRALQPKAIDHPAPAGIELFRTLGDALELENGQLTAVENRGAADRPGDLSGYPGPRPHQALVEITRPVSKARSFAPATAILRRHRQGKSSVEEAMLELYHGNVSVAGAEEVARQLWGETTSLALVCESQGNIRARIQAWLQREIAEPQVYVFIQSIEVKQRTRGESRVSRLAAAVGVCRQGTRQVLGAMPIAEPAEGGWDRLLADLRRRGLRGTALFIGENDPAACAAVAASFPAADYQGCLLQLEREVLARVRPAQIFSLKNALKGLRESPTEARALRAAKAVAAGLRKSGAPEAASLLERTVGFQYRHLNFPRAHRDRLHDIEPLRRLLREFRETIRLIGPVPDPAALTVLLAARLRHATRQSWARRRYIAL